MNQEVADGSPSDATRPVPGDGDGGQPVGAADAGPSAGASVDGGDITVGLGRATLLRDIVTDTGSSDPSGFVRLGSTVYAWAKPPLRGRALVRIRDDGVEIVRSFGDAGTTAPTVFQGRLYFGLSRGTGTELWRSDGSADGTERVLAELGGPLVAFELAGELLYFVVDGGPLDARTLWRSDGTEAGTQPLASIGAMGDPPALAVAGGYLFFVADSGAGVERAVWRSDGTLPGTIHLSDVYRRGKPTLAAIQGQVYFIGEQATDGGIYELSLWRTDGTLAGTVRAFDAPPYPQALSASGGHLYVQGDRFGALWASRNGTEPLVALTDAWPDTLEVSEAAGLYHSQDSVIRHDAATGRREAVYAVTSSSEAIRLFPAPNGTFVHVSTPDDAQLRFVSAAGSVLVRDGFPVGEARAFDGQLCMAGCTTGHGCEVWLSDGTPAGTREVADFFYGTTDSNPRAFVQVGGGPVLFAASTRLEGLEPWWTDGSHDGTHLLRDLSPGPDDGFDQHVGGAGDVRFFRPTQGLVDSDTWRVDTGGNLARVATNAVRSGWVRATPLRGHLLDGVGHDYAAPLGDFTGSTPTFLSGQRVYDDYTLVAGETGIVHFAGADYLAVSLAAEFASRYVLRWAASGQPTVAARTPAGGQGIRLPLVTTDEGVYFVAAGATAQELWRMGTSGDGAPVTSGGVRGANVLQAFEQTASGWVYFLSMEATRDVSLCRARGASTECLGVIHDGATLFDRFAQAASPASGDRLFVCTGEALWVTDGSAAGTKRLLSVASGSIEQCTALGNELFFSADDGLHGRELWRSDGTEQGTRIEADVYPGPKSSAPTALLSAGGKLYFAAEHPEYGVEPWRVQ